MKIRKYIFLMGILLLSGAFSCGSGDSSSPSPTPSPTPTPTPITQNFITFGDWGTATSNQQAVADLASTVCNSNTCDFALVLGDNFYPTGVSSTSDTQWQSKYRDMYDNLNLNFYALLGNHDWDSPANFQAEIDYSSINSTWIMPSAYYSHVFPDDSNPLLEIFVINSNDFKTNSDEQNWLSTQLAQSNATWKFLAFHHPVFSNGSAHTPDEKDIYPVLEPIICNKINLLISGHDHFFSHLRDETENCGYDQLVIGTGGKELYPIAPANSAPATILYSESNFGLAFFEITEENISLQFFETNGTASYSYHWPQ